MKKLLLLSFAFLFSMAMTAQNRAVLISESFDETSIPAGWSLAGSGTTNWSVSPSHNAGGAANEMMLGWSPQFNGTSRLVTPAVDLTGINNVVFSFKHALDNYSGSHTIGIATSSDNGNTWNVGWSQTYSASNHWSVTQEITTPDMGHANVKFCVFYTGNSYNMNYWYFDDIEVFTMENRDLGIVASNIPSFLSSGDFGFEVTVFNYGVTPVTSVEASYVVEGMSPVTQTFNVNIPSLGSYTLNFNDHFVFTPGVYTVDFNINKVNGTVDDVVDNNIYSTDVTVTMTSVQKIPMIEHFSSSTCGPCVSVNNQMLNFCNNNPGRFTYTKYQMNWPGNGDPYYTNEGGTRRTYYGVSAVPQCFLDGEDQGYAAVTANVFNQHAERDAFMDLRGSFTVEGNTINVKVDVMPYIDVEAYLFVSVNEKETHNNVGGNGETSFHHIFMKMLTSAQGNALNFAANELQHLEFTQNMSGTHVEEMSDLEVSIWVQNYGTKEVYNSHFAYEYTEVHPYPVENLTVNQSRDMFLATWNAFANSAPVGYNVYVNGNPVLENTTQTSYSFEGDAGGFYVVEVVALYPDDMTSVKAVAGVTAGLQDMGLLVEGSSDVVLDVDNPIARISVINANYNTEQTIQILGVTEADNEEGVPYLVITPLGDIPATLEVGESFIISLVPNYAGEAKSVAHTTVTVDSDAGSVEFFVEIDGELLHVTELSAETKLYPNPASDNFVVEGADMASVVVYNLVGQKIFEQHDQKLVRVNTADWIKGMYLVSVTNLDGTVETMKLMVK